jgi:uncharacterized protein YkwD
MNNSEILEGEIVESISTEETYAHSDNTPPKFNLFAIPIFARLRRNCLFSAISFFVLTILSIHFGNIWLFVLAILLPPWIFSSKKILIFTLIFCSVSTLTHATTFTDIDTNHPNAKAIDYLTREGIINGYSDNSFRPNKQVNRAEALKILLLASKVNLQNPQKNVFSDVSKNEWFASFVFSAKKLGIVDGYLDGKFRPEQTVNLVEALKMLLQSNSVPLENYYTNSQLFADTEKNTWYNVFLNYAQTFQIIEADANNRIFPNKPLTRAQLAEIVFRFYARVENTCSEILTNTKTIPKNYFRGVQINNNIPNVFYENEIFSLSGSTTDTAKNISVVLENRTNKEQEHFSGATKEQNFTTNVIFQNPGSYNFSIIPDTTNSNTAMVIEVLPRECQPNITMQNDLQKPTNVQTDLIDNQTEIHWDTASNNIFRIVIRQQENRFERLLSGGQTTITLLPKDFENFAEGTATLQIFGAKSPHGWSFEPRSQWIGSTVREVNLSQHHFSFLDNEKITLSNLPIYRSPNLQLTGTTTVDLENEVLLITPNGAVETMQILEGAKKISANSFFNVNLSLPELGTYILELNGANGIAVLNHPLYFSSTLPVLPDFADMREPRNENQSLSLNREKAIWLRMINQARAQQQLSKVNLDTELSAFAQNYAEQMAKENFFGHVDPLGNDPDKRRQLANLPMPVGENLARDYDTKYAHAGLLRSAAHRLNIMAQEWGRVGLGIAEDSQGNWLFVQEFSASMLSADDLSATRNDLLNLINAKRTKLGYKAFLADGQLNTAAQAWSEKMIADNFLDFKHGDNSFENSVRATGYAGSFTTFIASVSRLDQVVESLDNNIFTESGKSRVAIGVAQADDGRLRVSLVFRP